MIYDIDGLRIYYEVKGAGRPLLLLHGYGLDHRAVAGMFEPIFADRAGWRRIYLDLPGMGRSAAAAWVESSSVMLTIIERFVADVISDEPVVIAGHSYGGYLAQGLVYRRPERIDGLMLIVPTTAPGADRAQYEIPDPVVLEDQPGAMTSESGPYTSVLAGVKDLLVIRSHEVIQRTSAEILPGLSAGDPEFKARFRDSDDYRLPFDVTRLPRPFSKPMLLFCGRQDSVVGFPDVKSLLRSYPRGTAAVLDRAGHNAPIEQVLLFNTLTREWLDRIDRESMTGA